MTTSHAVRVRTADARFTLASTRPGDYTAQTAQASAVLEKLAVRLHNDGERIRPAVLAVAGMMYEWWEQGAVGTQDPRKDADRAQLQAMAAALRSS
ncbi:hypothetical protein Q3V30_22150 (plasmid) [Erwinia pyri]|uniref:Cell division protein ZapA n=1 Tax=Erwinia pyri TaxID=3062598 RepID=A0AA50DNI2_9GAMM|nr:hypothetical protein [Erwinia sp. DE2]WLS81161.1 hypothetical protein Q3V30_22150 [Erwinia sp. DE2]